MGKPRSGRDQKREHAVGCALALLLVQCGRFGFERLPLAEDPPLQLEHSSPSASCFDGVQNLDEGGLDCGGVCAPCAVEASAVEASASCSDGIQNQDEGGLDCGGSCAPCPVEASASCSDGVQNQGEAGIDCGGSCVPCAVEASASCSDGVQNQDEAGIDCGGAACPACVPTRCNQVLADSVLDFSSTQGARGWYYGYYVEPLLGSADFQQLPIYEHVAVLNEDIWRYGDQAWTHIGARVMHPNGRFTTGGKLAIDQFAVRRWVSTTTETLFIQGTIQTTGASANGVLGRILVGDSEVWRQFVGPGPTSPIAFDTLVSVQVGAAVNFVLEPFQSNDSSDATDFVVQICR